MFVSVLLVVASACKKEFKTNTIVNYILIVFTSFNLFGQVDSSIHLSKNFVFATPTSIFSSSLLDLENYWVMIGYERRFEKNFYSSEFGVIVHSKSSINQIIPNIDQQNSNGIQFNLHYSRVLKKKFYAGLLLSNQFMKTNRLQDYSTPNGYGTASYAVYRNEFGLIPKIGFKLWNTKQLSYDIGLGIGLGYVTSRSPDKPTADNYQFGKAVEIWSQKPFDDGSKFFIRFALQWRVGYSF